MKTAATVAAVGNDVSSDKKKIGFRDCSSQHKYMVFKRCNKR